MSAYPSLLSLGLLAFLAGAGHAAEPPFPAESSFGPQVAVRLIGDGASQEPSMPDGAEEGVAPASMPDGSAEDAPEAGSPPAEDTPEAAGSAAEDALEAESLPAEGAPSRQVSDMPAPREDGLEAPGLEGEIERDPELAGQDTLEEKREKGLAGAEMALDRLDEILLDARDRTRQDREEAGGGGGAGTSAMDEGTEIGEEVDDAEGEAEEEEPGREGVAEGQVPGDAPTGKTRASRGYGGDDDIVARQVCDLARQEEDPEVRKHLEEKCKSLRRE